MREVDADRPTLGVAVGAAALPSLLAYNTSPSPTFFNQALAFLLWSLVVLVTAAAGTRQSVAWRDIEAGGAVMAALLILAGAAAWSWGAGPLPSSLALSTIGTLCAAAVLLAGGLRSARAKNANGIFLAFCLAWVVAGVLNGIVAGIQVLAPWWADGDWIARSSLAGRAVGNLRQPNHLSSLLLWSAIAVVGVIELQRLRFAVGAALLAVLVYAVVLTASRTGLVGVILLALWGAFDRRLSKRTRMLLVSTPVIYVAAWMAMAEWSAISSAAFGGRQRLETADISASRFAIWSDALSLIRSEPWTGVGFGLFNFAWSLSVMPHRPVAFFDHAHNLPLQLAAELGVPVAAAVLVLLSIGLVQAWRRSGRGDAADASGVAARCATAMVVMIGLHSLLEYPLWYAYFLLPTAWAWGFALGRRPERSLESGPATTIGAWVLAAAGALVSIGAVFAVVDYVKVARIFSSSPVPLAERVAEGKRSTFFAHHAHYAAATSGDEPADRLPSFAVSAFYLLDTRLMVAWAQAYAAAGDLVRARHLAARLREFHNPDSRAFFAACEATPPPPALPFQCEPPTRELSWHDFVPRRSMAPRP